MRNWLTRVMAGRYGGDNLNKFLCGAAVVALLLSLFVKGLLSTFFWLIAVASLVWSYMRIFSRRIDKRQKENLRYMHYKYEVCARVRAFRQRWSQRRDYRFFKCPSCGIIARVPKGKGKIRITCPKCGHEFEKRS